MSRRQLVVEGWEFRTALIQSLTEWRNERKKVTRTVEKNRKLRSKKGTTESKEERKRKRVQSKAKIIQKAGNHKF
jgi:hypothetical protein